ncbi:hypothetical protein J6590_036269 [Homalodisca vitripennis]|nr:hypothetical protein J6590_036269 [Homalodisca vitripennis]
MRPSRAVLPPYIMQEDETPITGSRRQNESFIANYETESRRAAAIHYAGRRDTNHRLQPSVSLIPPTTCSE